MRAVMRITATCVVALFGAAAVSACGTDQANVSRQHEVADRGSVVMPFDLDATVHVFSPRPDGGVQEVKAIDPGDDEQVQLIRQHLTEEADRFAVGDFGDPAAIHGHDMPGLAALEAGHQAIEVTYGESPGGATLTYRTSDGELVDAVHAWFAAQVSDHGDHARHEG